MNVSHSPSLGSPSTILWACDLLTPKKSARSLNLGGAFGKDTELVLCFLCTLSAIGLARVAIHLPGACKCIQPESKGKFNINFLTDTGLLFLQSVLPLLTPHILRLFQTINSCIVLLLCPGAVLAFLRVPWNSLRAHRIPQVFLPSAATSPNPLAPLARPARPPAIQTSRFSHEQPYGKRPPRERYTPTASAPAGGTRPEAARPSI